MYIKFLWSLLRHKWFVIVAGRFVGVPLWRLLIHDWQKFTPLEFGKYARNFQGERTEKVKCDFSYAWLHHENTAPHHWGYWVPRSGSHVGDPLDMPMIYVREMVADWMGASKAYTGSFDVSSWYNKNGPGFKMSFLTYSRIDDVLLEMDYFLTDNCDFSWMAGKKFRVWSGERLHGE